MSSDSEEEDDARYGPGDLVWLDKPNANRNAKKRQKTSKPGADSIILEITRINATATAAPRGECACTGVQYLRGGKDVLGSKLGARELFKTLETVTFTQSQIRGKLSGLNAPDGLIISPLVYDVRTKRLLNSTQPGNQAVSSAAAESQSPHERAKQMLQNSSKPSAPLQCRAKERARIQAFIERGVRANGSKLGLYISGLPGSGKTFTVREVVAACQHEQKGLCFDYLEINGLKVESGEEVFQVLARQFLDQSRVVASKTLKMELDAFFREKPAFQPRKPTVLLIDEMDQLMTGEEGQDVLFQLFNFAQHTHAGLVLLAIANTLDLNERVLAKIRSRLGEEKLSFASYGKEDIEHILLDRVRDCNVFERDAISFCALKVASTSGDIRRAMRVCCKALDILGQQQHGGLVSVAHITQAWVEMETAGTVSRAVRYLSPLEKLLLISVGKLGNQTTFEHVYRRVVNVGQLIPDVKQCLPMPQSMMAICKDKLCRSHLLHEDEETAQLRLGMDQEDLNQVMNADPVFRQHM